MPPSPRPVGLTRGPGSAFAHTVAGVSSSSSETKSIVSLAAPPPLPARPPAPLLPSGPAMLPAACAVPPPLGTTANSAAEAGPAVCVGRPCCWMGWRPCCWVGWLEEGLGEACWPCCSCCCCCSCCPCKGGAAVPACTCCWGCACLLCLPESLQHRPGALLLYRLLAAAAVSAWQAVPPSSTP